MGADVDVTSNMQLKMTKKTFLGNPRNKQKFINLLGSEMEKHSMQVKYSTDDADYDIVMTACQSALSTLVVVVGEDTDLLILLLHHLDPDVHDTVYMKTNTKMINVSTLQGNLEEDLRKSILFIHAASGCDTTSRPYGIGKVSAMSKYPDLVQSTKVFLMPNRTHGQIEDVGHQTLAVLYGCIPGTLLDFERATRFSSKVVTKSTHLPPERLPPTSDAAKYHSYRVYHQVQTWVGNRMDPTKWGWVISKGQRGDVLKPVRMDQDAAPPSLLKLIKCNCGGKCDRNTCSCRKHGLPCTLACGQCKGITCTNVGTSTPDSAEGADDE